MTIQLQDYHDRFNPADRYDRWLFRSGMTLQGPELNEIQSAAHERLRGITDALLRDGAVLSGGECILSVNGPVCTAALEAGSVYLRGAARLIAPRTFTFPATGRVSVGIYLVDTVITEHDDPGLRDPSILITNNQEPGAARLRVMGTWGFAGSGQAGDYYAVYDVEDGVLLSRAPPPQVEAIAQSIARYDRQSAGGFYVASGLRVTRLADDDGQQVYSMSEGVARVAGVEIIRDFARRFRYRAIPDTRSVSMEAHAVSAEASLGDDVTATLAFTPIVAVTSASAVREVTHTWVRGLEAGTTDLLPHVPVVSIQSITQGATTYTPTTDYVLNGNQVDWSPGGLEPSPGSTYSITYRYSSTIGPNQLLEQTDTSITIPGTLSISDGQNGTVDAEIVPGTTAFVFYSWALPRFDRLCMDVDGEVYLVRGVSAAQSPRIPPVPSGLLGIALIDQRWNGSTRLVNNAVRMVPMNDINRMNRQIETLFALVAEERLALNITARDPAAKKGVLSDPLLDDDLRDQGRPQTAAINNGILTLGVNATVHAVTLDANQTLDARILIEIDETVGPDEIMIEQPLKTSTMRVNPYDAFGPLPGTAVLRPAVDLWTEFQTNWLSPVTLRFDESVWNRMTSQEASLTEGADVEKVAVRDTDIVNLRQIKVQFDVSGFGPGEILSDVRFDGIPVVFTEVTPDD